jgi:hypothetical protein
MVRREGLPRIEVRTEGGYIAEITLDGQPLKNVKAITFTADAQGGWPVVTMEMWADIALSGELQAKIRQERSVARCTRPHAEEAAPSTAQAPETAPVAAQGLSGACHGIGGEQWTLNGVPLDNGPVVVMEGIEAP